MNSSREIGGFKILRLHLKHLPIGAVHYLYFRQHKNVEGSGQPELPAERTLFVVNPSVSFQEDDFRRIFEAAGPVERVLLGTLGTSSTFTQRGTAHIVYGRAKDAQRALNRADTSKELAAAAAAAAVAKSSEPKTHEAAGLGGWVNEYKQARLPASVIRKKADSFISEFSEAEAKAEAARRAAAKADDEGWITVSSRKKRDRPEPKAKKGKTKTPHEVASNTSLFESKVLDDFYVFQRQEKRRRELAQLRESFAADKARIAKMHGERKFRPY